MKRLIFLSVLFLFVVNSVSAQITKGNWMVGGSGMFKKEKTKMENSELRFTSLELTPRAGYFLTDNFAAGLKGLLILYKTTELNSVGKGSSFGLGPFVRYYFLSEENNINVLAEIFGGYSNSGTKDIRYKYWDYSFSAGPAIFLNSSVALELLLNYNRTVPQARETNTMLYRSNLQFSIGLQVHLEK